jgi:hypothetical protein
VSRGVGRGGVEDEVILTFRFKVFDPSALIENSCRKSQGSGRKEKEGETWRISVMFKSERDSVSSNSIPMRNSNRLTEPVSAEAS